MMNKVIKECLPYLTVGIAAVWVGTWYWHMCPTWAKFPTCVTTCIVCVLCYAGCVGIFIDYRDK